MSLSPGTRLGRYEILGLLGAGGMGVVYRARDPHLGREVAIKVLPEFLGESKTRLERFEQEARSASMLNHPNILSVFDVGAHEGAPFLVCELLEGETLALHLAKGAVPAKKAIRYATEVARGLAAAHEKGVVHRDLKPGNLFVTSEGGVKILDFGLAKLVESPALRDSSDAPTAARLTESGVILGTAGYMSPEQVRGEKLDARSDLFSLGVVLQEMLAGSPPFHRPTAAETMSAILNEEPPELDPERVSPALARIVEHALEKRPENRFQTSRDLVFDLETVASYSGSSPKLKAAPHRGRGLSLLAVGAAAVLAAFVVGRGSVTGPDGAATPNHHRLTFRRGFVWNARFAPDGEGVFYSATWEGVANQLYSTRAGSPESRPLGHADTDVLAVSPEGEIAVALNPDHRGNRILGTLAVMPLDGAAPRPLVEDVAAADWPRNGGELAALHHVDGLARVEYPVGKVLYETARGLVEFLRVSPDGNRVAFDEADAIVVVDRSGSKRVLTTGWSGRKSLAWSPDGEEVWFSGSPRGGFSPSTYAVSLEGRVRLVAWGFEIHDVSRAGKALLTRRDVHKGITFVDTKEGRERDLSWLDWAHVADISEDGGEVLFTEAGEGGGPQESVYWRATSGEPAVRLGNGKALSLSPDGAFAMAFRIQGTRVEFVSIPTGVGQEQVLWESSFVPEANARNWYGARWLPDGEQVVLSSAEPNRGPRAFVLSLQGSAPKTITPEGTFGVITTPDGGWLLAGEEGATPRLFPLAGGAPRPVPGLEPADTPLRFNDDGRLLYVRRDFGEDPDVVSLYRIDVSSGKRTLLREYVPDPLRSVEVLPLAMTSDARFLAYSYARKQVELYLVEGLK